MTVADGDLVTENARLRAELAVERQRAEAAEAREAAVAAVLGLLRTMSGDAQAILDGITEHAGRLTASDNASLFILRDGRTIPVAGWDRLNRARARSLQTPGDGSEYSAYALSESVSGTAITDSRTIAVAGGADAIAERFPATADGWRRMWQRDGIAVGSAVHVPLVRGSDVIGTLVVRRPALEPYSAQQITLLEAFAAQAVVALENARLFHETQQQSRDLEASNAQLRDALEQQTVMATVLSAVARAGSDAEPVLFDIAEQAGRLLGCASGSLYLFDSALASRVLIAFTGPMTPEDSAAGSPYTRVAPNRVVQTTPRPRAELARSRTNVGEVLRSGRPAQIWGSRAEVLVRYPDMGLGVGPGETRQELARLAVPLLVQGEVTGILQVSQWVARPFTARQTALLQAFADQAVIAVENARLLHELQASNAGLRESLERQTATAEVLRIISSSPTAVQPVFAAIAESALTLCAAEGVAVWQLDGMDMVTVANTGRGSGIVGSRTRLGSLSTVSQRAIAECRTIHIPDAAAENDPAYASSRAWAQTSGVRTVLSIPLLLNGQPLGAISLHRYQVQPFTGTQIALVQTFADQAVIAIENARLFAETQQKTQELETSNANLSETLEQQTATSEILRAISTSPTDPSRALRLVVESAARFTGVPNVAIWQVVDRELHFAATVNSVLRDDVVREPRPLTPDDHMSWPVLTAKTLHLADLREHLAQFPESRDVTERGARSVLVAPVLRAGRAVGVVSTLRLQVKPYTPSQIALFERFADQAAIALENAHLIAEIRHQSEQLEERNREQAETLERERATAEVLDVISRAPTELQAVLDAIVERAARLLQADWARIHRLVADALPQVAGWAEGQRTAARLDRPESTFAVGGRGPLTVLAVQERRTIHRFGGPAALADEFPAMVESWQRTGVGSGVAVPLLRGDTVFGALMVSRRSTEAFSPGQLALLETFADQAVIAIENARLFEELQASNAGLREALEHQQATAEILRIIASTPTDVQPVLDGIVQHAATIMDSDRATVWRIDGDDLVPWAHSGQLTTGLPLAQPIPLAAHPGIQEVVRSVHTIHTADALLLDDVQLRREEELYGMSRDRFSRSRLTVPLVRDGAVLGVLAVLRRALRPFTDREIMLLETFADQAVVAIANTRLFDEVQTRTREVEERNAQLTETLAYQQATSEVLELISRAPMQLQVVLDGIVARAARLCGAVGAFLHLITGEVMHMVARHNLGPSVDPSDQVARRFHTGPERTFPSSVAVLERRAVYLAGTVEEFERAYPAGGAFMRRQGLDESTYLAVPLVQADAVVGVLTAVRHDRQGFTAAQIALAETFAAQAVIAIENARLFQQIQSKSEELEETNRQLEDATQHKSAFLSAMSHELRTPLNAVIGYSEMLAEEAQDLGEPRFVADLEKINGAGKHLLSLISNVLDLSKIESGKMDVLLSDFAVQTVLNEVEAVVPPLMEQHSNRFVLDVAADLGVMHSDQTRLRQCLLNLLSNAAKFTEQGAITLAARRETDPAGDWLVLTVSDTGIGMAAEQLARLFQTFTQAEVGTSATYGGTGLGLALSRDFCRLLGGDISVVSKPGRGSMFTMRLPATVTLT